MASKRQMLTNSVHTVHAIVHTVHATTWILGSHLNWGSRWIWPHTGFGLGLTLGIELALDLGSWIFAPNPA